MVPSLEVATGSYFRTLVTTHTPRQSPDGRIRDFTHPPWDGGDRAVAVERVVVVERVMVVEGVMVVERVMVIWRCDNRWGAFRSTSCGSYSRSVQHSCCQGDGFCIRSRYKPVQSDKRQDDSETGSVNLYCFVSDFDTKRLRMTRTISSSLAPVLEQLELRAEDLVTTEQLDELVQAAGIGTSTRLVAARLRERGWLLNTGERGVWEFAPAAVAGPYSRGGPTRLFRSFLAHSNVVGGLTFQAAAWALNAADRAPARPEIALANRGDLRRTPKGLDASVFDPYLPYAIAKGAPTLQPASILVHMAQWPNRVRSWVSAQEWLPEIAAEANTADVLTELHGRAATVSARTGYLLQGLRPDIAADIPQPCTTTWFGRRRPLKRRRDNHWKVADTLLPFNPRDLRPVTSRPTTSKSRRDGSHAIRPKGRAPEVVMPQ
jgi:hypothetical protein